MAVKMYFHLLALLLIAVTPGTSETSQCKSSGQSNPAFHEQLQSLNRTDAKGSAITLQAIGALQQSRIFGDDSGILRRIAYVETRDGTRGDALSDGGIWAVNVTKFLRTQNTEDYPRLPLKLQQIQDVFKIDWLAVVAS